MIKINGTIIEQGKFPDGTLLVKYDAEEVVFPTTIEWNYENDGELFTLICLKRHLDNYAGAISHIHLILPYLPNARQDRVKKPEDVFTLKYFCETINSLNFDRVSVLDVHSNVSLALLNRVEQIDVMKHIDEAIQDIYFYNGGANASPLVTFFPDEGAMKRYADMVGLPYAFGIKKRDWETGKIQGLDIQNKELIEGKDVLIIDDICSYGGTFYHSAKALKEAGAASVSLYVTHLEESVLKGDLWKAMQGDDPLIKTIYTANPLFEAKDPDLLKIGAVVGRILKV